MLSREWVKGWVCKGVELTQGEPVTNRDTLFSLSLVKFQKKSDRFIMQIGINSDTCNFSPHVVTARILALE